jgi:hypothetical protein
MKTFVAMAALVMAMGMGARDAHAAPVTFNFYCGDGVVSLKNGGGNVSCNSSPDVYANTLTYTTGGISVTATATTSGAASKVYHDVSPQFGGLAVGNDSTPKGDNIGLTEILKLTFSENVRITKLITFTDHEKTFDNGSVLHLAGVDVTRPHGSTVYLNMADFGAPPTGKTFEFSVGTIGRSSRYDGYYISSVTVERVPEATTLSMIGIGLLGLARVVRRRQA